MSDGALLRELATDGDVDAFGWSGDGRMLLAGEDFGRGVLFIAAG